MYQVVRTLLVAAPFLAALVAALSVMVTPPTRAHTPRSRSRSHVGRHYATRIFAEGQTPTFTRQLLATAPRLTVRQQLFLVASA